MSTAPPLATDAAFVLGIASTAIPFACTPEAEAECWLRILRLYGDAGVTLQALGVGEDRLEALLERDGREPEASDRAEEIDQIAHVADAAARIADERGASGIATTDLLLAVMQVYGEHFDRALRTHGTNRDEVSERLRGRLRVEPPTSST
jgi:ATP-dependent Clp protease ATP-binding subunit ClpA